jgi:hypothetical protein
MTRRDRDADEQAARGEGEVFLSDEEFLDSLEQPDAQRVAFEDEDKPS